MYSLSNPTRKIYTGNDGASR